MRVVQINSVFQYGSTGKITEELDGFFRENGIDSSVICTNTNNRKKNIYKVGTLIEGKIHALLSRIFGLRGYFSYFSTKSILNIINEINPDIIILHNLHNNYVNVPRLLDLIANKNIKTIWVLHDCWAFTGGCMHYTALGCNEWLNGCHHCAFPEKALSSWIFNTSSKQYRDRIKYFGAISDLTIVGVSNWITGESRRSFLSGIAKRIVRIYNWIDVDVFHPRSIAPLKHKIGLPDNAFIVIGIAQTWDEDKGLSLFLRVAETLPDIYFMMIGKLSCPLPNNVISIGTVSDPASLSKYYSMADVMVNLTQQETFGKVTAEALACGTPVIVNNNTACPEVVGDCGFVIENNNIQSCIMALQHIRDVGKSSYKEKCVERARSLFSKEVVLKEWLNLIDKVYKS